MASAPGMFRVRGFGSFAAGMAEPGDHFAVPFDAARTQSGLADQHIKHATDVGVDKDDPQPGHRRAGGKLPAQDGRNHSDANQPAEGNVEGNPVHETARAFQSIGAGRTTRGVRHSCLIRGCECGHSLGGQTFLSDTRFRVRAFLPAGQTRHSAVRERADRLGSRSTASAPQSATDRNVCPPTGGGTRGDDPITSPPPAVAGGPGHPRRQRAHRCPGAARERQPNRLCPEAAEWRKP